LGGGAVAQDAAKLASAYEGGWLWDEAGYGGKMRLNLVMAPDGAITGTFIRRDAALCNTGTDGNPLTGTFSGNTLNVKVAFKEVRCNGMTWTLNLQPDGSLVGTGASTVALSARLKAVK
jgi:hypothetical protein